MTMICSRAPAKTILFGEHFVVLGKPALVTAIDVYAKVCIKDSSRIIIESKNLGEKLIKDVYEPKALLPYLRIVEELLNGSKECFHAIIDSEIPIGSGMGSSAATAVAFTHALSRYLGLDLDLEDISKIAYKAEELIHGKPSGIDNTISTYGGFLYYQEGVFKHIDIPWPQDYSLILIDTGVKRSTKVAVEKVLKRYEKKKSIMKYLYDAAEEIVHEAIKALKRGDVESLGELMNINHGLLVSLGVAIPETETIVHESLRHGALGAKITGAGMGGCVLVFVKKTEVRNILKSISQYSKAYYVVKPGVKGVEHW